jgi:phenylacetate-CoA ligase
MLGYLYRAILIKNGPRNDTVIPDFFYSTQFLKNFLISLDTYVLLKSQYWPRQEVRELQLKQIKKILIHANKNIPFWKEILAKQEIKPEESIDWNIFSKIPITKKEDFKNKPIKLFTDSIILKKNSFSGTTSGTTGEPFEFFLDPYFSLRSTAICQRMFIQISAGKLLPMLYIRAKYRHGFANKKSTWFFSYSFNDLQYRIEKLYALAKKNKGDYIMYGFSSYFLEITRLCKERNIFLQPKSIILSGESLTSQEKEYIEKNLHTKVFRAYSTQELGWLAQDCENGNMHIHSEFTYIETINNEGYACKENEIGRVIVTTFDNKVMPFIRYDTGDLGTLSNDFCKCGKTSPCISIVGRQIDFIKLSTGKKVPFINIKSIFIMRLNTIRQFQVIERSPDTFLIKIKLEEPIIKPKDDFFLEISNDLYKLLSNQVKISFEIVENIPTTVNGKKKDFISLIKK